MAIYLGDFLKLNNVIISGGKKINMPLKNLYNEALLAQQMLGGTIRSSDIVDTSNISGKKLAEIGRAVLGMRPGDAEYDINPKKYAGQYTDAAWLDMRVEEICKKGRLS